MIYIWNSLLDTNTNLCCLCKQSQTCMFEQIYVVIIKLCIELFTTLNSKALDTLCWHVQHFTSSAALLYLWIRDWAFYCHFLNELSVTPKRKTIFNKPIQLLRKSKLLEKCCWKTMNKKQCKICTRSCPNRSYEIWKLIEERNWKCICIKVKPSFISFPSQRDRLKKLGR